MSADSPVPPGAVVRLRGSRSQMVADDVYDSLTGTILRSEMPPGARVNIEALAVKFAVSATPVREALARLEADGLVVREHLKGYRTRGLLTRDELEQLFQLRLLLEPHAAAAAAITATEAQLDAVSREAATQSEAPFGTDYDSYKEFCAHDSRLHALVLEAGGNAAITDAVCRNHFHVHAFRLGYDATSGQETVLEHAAIVTALLARDAPAAHEAMRTHIANSRDRLLPRAAPAS